MKPLKVFQIVCIDDDESSLRFEQSCESLKQFPWDLQRVGSLDGTNRRSKSTCLKEIQQQLQTEPDSVKYVCLLDDDIQMLTFPTEEMLYLLDAYDIIVPIQLEDSRHWTGLHEYHKDMNVFTSSQTGAFAYGCALMRKHTFLRCKFDFNESDGYGLDDCAFHGFTTALSPLWKVVHPWETPERQRRKKLFLHSHSSNASMMRRV